MPAAVAQAMPFALASRQGTRDSFDLGTFTLNAQTQQLSPVIIPPSGYLRGIMLDVTITGTGGTTPAFTADAPFNVLGMVNFRTSSGSDVMTPMTGYQHYLINKYGAQYTVAPLCDMRSTRQYSATAPSAHFFLPIWFETDPETGLGCLPALSASKTYQLVLQLAPLAALVSGSPTVTVSIKGTAYYWTEPAAKSAGGIDQLVAPLGLGTISQWQLDSFPVTPGEKGIRITNTGNILRTLIFTLRNAAGARIDAAGWPVKARLNQDNFDLFAFSQNEWEQFMISKYGFTASNKDVANGLDTGVYAMPYHALAGGLAGEPPNSRAQLNATLNATLLQVIGTWGANASSVEIITNSMVPGMDRELSTRAILSK